MNRKHALKRLNGLAPQVENHLAKLAAEPDGRDAAHWVKEIESWLDQMERVLPDTGDKTEAEWRARIAGWKARIGD